MTADDNLAASAGLLSLDEADDRLPRVGAAQTAVEVERAGTALPQARRPSPGPRVSSR